MIAAPKSKAKPQIVNPVFTDADLGSNRSLVTLAFFSLNDFFDWWYIQMPIIYISRLRRLSLVVDDKLSITLLISTFFTPWHRDYTPVGLFMGIMTRIVYLPVALLIYFSTVLPYMLFIFLWIFLPMLTLIFIFITPFIRQSP